MDTQNIQIRQALPTDAPIFAQFIVDYGAEHGFNIDLPSVSCPVGKLLSTCAEADSHTVFLAEDPDALLGYTVVHWVPFLVFRETEAYISELFVANSHRGSGIGSQLLSLVESKAQDRGCFRLLLNNLKGADSYKRRFYEKRGFTERTAVGNFVKELGKK